MRYLKFLLPKNWRPIYVENSRVPGWLSKIAPLEISAVTLFFIVFSKGKMGEVIKRHETIHFQQTLETFLIFTILIYPYDWIKGRIKYRNNWDEPKKLRIGRYSSAGNKAYYQIRMEQEAYSCQGLKDYLDNRKRYQWLWKYKV